MNDRRRVPRHAGGAGRTRCRSGAGNGWAPRSAPGHRDPSAAAVVRVRVGREPVPRPVVAEAHERTARSVVARDEPPNIPIEVPARLNEHVVDPHLDTVPVDPCVLSVAVVPIPMNPNPSRTVPDLLGARRDPRRRWRSRRGGDGLRLLHHDEDLPVDFRGRSRFRFHDWVGRRFH